MDVVLKQTWFAPNGRRYRKGAQVVPDELRPQLPSSAVVGKPKAGAPPPVQTLTGADVARAAAEAEAAARAKAEADTAAKGK